MVSRLDKQDRGDLCSVFCVLGVSFPFLLSFVCTGCITHAGPVVYPHLWILNPPHPGRTVDYEGVSAQCAHSLLLG